MTRAGTWLAGALVVVVAAGLSCRRNHPPDIPAVPTGPVICFKDTSHEFATAASDPDGDSLSVHFSWSETWPSNWVGWYASGDTVEMSRAWPDTGTYQVRAEARDRQELTSGWSEPLTVRVVLRRPPDTPERPTGRSAGDKDSLYTFGAVAFHPDSLPVAIRFSWGDGDTSDWSPFGPVGETVRMSHVWTAPATYGVTAQARDTGNALSHWSGARSIRIRPPDTMSRWRFPLAPGRALYSSPAIGPDGTVYVGSTDSCLYAVNPDGTLRWSYRTGNEVHSSPAIGLDGTVYFGSLDGRLYAVNPDGSLRWSYLTGASITSSPAVAADGTVYIGSYDSAVYALNPDGTLRWRYATGGAVVSSPAVAADGTVYFGSNDYLIRALDADGALKWSWPTGSTVKSSPAITAEGAIYIGSSDGYVYSLRADGTLRWRYRTGGLVRSQPVIAADGTVYVGSSNDYLHALNSGGGLKWSCYMYGSVDAAAAVCSDSTVYVGSDDDYLYALNPDGTIRWSYETDANVESSPAIGPDGTVYFTSYTGFLYALKGTGTLANTPWPKFRHDNRNTGRVGGGR